MSLIDIEKIKAAVDSFAEEMKGKLVHKYFLSWTGWDNPHHNESLKNQLKSHVIFKELKGDNLVDIANLAMFLRYQEKHPPKIEAEEAEHRRMLEKQVPSCEYGIIITGHPDNAEEVFCGKPSLGKRYCEQQGLIDVCEEHNRIMADKESSLATCNYGVMGTNPEGDPQLYRCGNPAYGRRFVEKQKRVVDVCRRHFDVEE